MPGKKRTGEQTRVLNELSHLGALAAGEGVGEAEREALGGRRAGGGRVEQQRRGQRQVHLGAHVDGTIDTVLPAMLPAESKQIRTREYGSDARLS